MIKKIKVFKLKKIKNNLGNITKFINKNDKFFKKFGEVYFSDIKKDKEKGWNLHKKSTCLITCFKGKVLFTLSDYKLKKKIKLTLNSKIPKILIIPPYIWFKFKSIGGSSTIINLIDNEHDKNETEKKLIKKKFK